MIWAGARPGRAAAVAVTTTVGVLLAGVLAAAPASAEPECLGASSDFDRDGSADTVVGAPGGGSVRGSVTVHLSGGGDPRTVVLRGPVGFGTSVGQVRSYEREGDDEFCTQLVVGSPEETVNGMPRAGAVHVYSYDSTVEEFQLRGRVTADSESVLGVPQTGARFGATVASASFAEETIDPVSELLWVGSPGHDLTGAPDAGRVTSFVLTSGDGELLATGGDVLDLPDVGVRGSAAAGARLGSALSVRGTVLAAGAPGLRVGGDAGAGGVVLAFTPLVFPDEPEDPVQHAPVLVHQDLARVAGVAEAGDAFGAAVHLVPVRNDPAVDLVVGSPGEDLGGRADAGMVSVGRVHPALSTPAGDFRSVHQGTPGSAGNVEAGDRFGSAVSSAYLRWTWRVVVGVPGEDVGSARDTGMVQVLGTDQGWHQGSPEVPGGNETGDRMGATLGGDPGVRDGLAPDVGVPGEDAATGAVITGLLEEGAVVDRERGTTAGARFGQALAP
ncbi:hypothetical protein [Isoptericola jiangsuensis]|nr:hypothetical protein [Isoptericola jiangsuensis]